MGRAPAVSVLTAATGLGVYIPALLLERQLAALDVRAEVEVLEGYYTPAGLQRQAQYQKACRDRFELALMGHRLARGAEDCLDEARVAALLRRWAAEERRHFIVWSGFWLPILERYRVYATPLHVDCCRIDAEVSASFRAYPDLATDATEIWLWNWEQRRTVFEIAVTDRSPLPVDERDHRLVVHGGGWGLGTYRERRAELAGSAWACDLVVHDGDEAAGARACDRVFRVDPTWRPWQRRGGALIFPPLAERGGNVSSDGHALFEIIRGAKAIVSKPGGGTLIDSLAAATPVVLLEPYGYAEAANAALWQHLGFGIAYETWRASGFDPSPLARLQENLLRRQRQGPEYARAYVEGLLKRKSA
jgi:hypothetical protein